MSIDDPTRITSKACLGDLDSERPGKARTGKAPRCYRNAIVAILALLLVGPWTGTVYAGLSSQTITTKYTWPRGHNRASECDLSQTAAENRVNDFARKVGRTNVVSVDVSDCDCKKGPDKLWGCRATATIEYWMPPEGGLERDVKKAVLEKFVSHVVPKAQSGLAPLLKLQGMNRTLGFLKGSRVLSYAGSFQGILNRTGRAKEILERIQSNTDYQLTREENKLVDALERSYSKMQRQRSNFRPLERRLANGDSAALAEMKRQWENKFRADQCISAKVRDGKTVLTNSCGHSVWVKYCLTQGKKTCRKGKKYYRYHVKLRPRETTESGYQIPAGAGVDFAACVERGVKSVEGKGKISCANPY